MANNIFRHDKYGPWAPKYPESRLDYGFQWANRLQTAENIVSSVWSSETSGMVVASTHLSGTKAVVWASGGSHGNTYWFKNWIRTNEGREMVEKFRLKVSTRWAGNR